MTCDLLRKIKSRALCVHWAKYHSHVLLDSGAVRSQGLLFDLTIEGYNESPTASLEICAVRDYGGT